MPRFKPVERGLHLLAVDLSQQLRPGSFEYTLDYLIDHEINLEDIEARYRNEHEGAVAYDPRVLLKIVLSMRSTRSSWRPRPMEPARSRSCCCQLYRNGGNCNIGGRQAIMFTGAKRDCEKCPLRAQCLRHPQRAPIRQVAIFLGKHAKAAEKAIERMKRKIDTEQGREMIARRFATVEPVFGNLRHNKGLNRFTL